MSVEIEPTELSFKRPFTAEVAQILRIKNPNKTPVAFKVKTTAPKQYCVRPNSGAIEPGREVEVTVLLQAMKQEPPLDQKCRDKFLVQSVAMTGDREFQSVSTIWQQIDGDRTSIQEKKIRVVWLPADPSPPAQLQTPKRDAVNGFEHDVAPPAYSPHVAQAGNETIMETPQALRDEPPPRHVNEPQPEATKPSKALDSPAPAQDASQATTGDVKAKVASAVQPSYEELKQRLAETEALLANLKAEMSQGLRQRAAAGSKAVADTVPEDVKAKASELATAVSHQAQQAAQVTEGVSVQTTAILCLLCFLLAYLFF